MPDSRFNSKAAAVPDERLHGQEHSENDDDDVIRELKVIVV